VLFWHFSKNAVVLLTNGKLPLNGTLFFIYKYVVIINHVFLSTPAHVRKNFLSLVFIILLENILCENVAKKASHYQAFNKSYFFLINDIFYSYFIN